MLFRYCMYVVADVPPPLLFRMDIRSANIHLCQPLFKNNIRTDLFVLILNKKIIKEVNLRISVRNVLKLL